MSGGQSPPWGLLHCQEVPDKSLILPGLAGAWESHTGCLMAPEMHPKVFSAVLSLKHFCTNQIQSLFLLK